MTVNRRPIQLPSGWLFDGCVHSGCLLSHIPFVGLAAVCSHSREHGEAFASRHNIPYVFTSVEEMVSGDVVDAVYVASPNYAHAHQSIICMRHGKHVLCEKPMASNTIGAERMIAASKQYGVAMMEGMMTTLPPALGAIRANIHLIGQIRSYFASYCQYSSRQKTSPRPSHTMATIMR